MGSGELSIDTARLGLRQRADAVDEDSSLLQQGDRVVQQALLQRYQAIDGRLLDPPPGVRAAAKGSESGARRINQDPIEAGAWERRA